MRFVTLPQGSLDSDEHGSRNITMMQIARSRDGAEFRTHFAWCGPNSVLGKHPTRLWQLFVVVHGSGWVANQVGQRFSITSGEAVLWSPGEMHESGSDDGMLVTITQSSAPFADQKEILVDAAKAIEQAPQHRGSTTHETQEVTDRRDAIADPLDPFTTK